MRAASVFAPSVCLCAIACSGSRPEDGAVRVRDIDPQGEGLDPAGEHAPSGSAFGDGQAGCARDPRPPASEVWLANIADDDVLELSSVATDVANNVLLARSAGETRKLGPGGNTLWAKDFGSLVATDGIGNAYITGTSNGDPELGASNADGQGGNVFVAKLDPAGNLVYVTRVGTAPVHGITGLAVDAQGNAVVSGKGLGTVKLDAAGHPLWNRGFEGNLAIDSKGNVLMTGGFSGTVDFGGGSLVSAGGEDIFVTKLDPAGNHIFSKRFGDAGPHQRG
jgi:hypothetical protein